MSKTPDFCSQCGQPYSAAACGPTHAVIAMEKAQAEPTVLISNPVQARLEELDRQASAAARAVPVTDDPDDDATKAAHARGYIYREQVRALLERNVWLEMQMAVAWQERGDAIEQVASTREQNARLREALQINGPTEPRTRWLTDSEIETVLADFDRIPRRTMIASEAAGCVWAAPRLGAEVQARRRAAKEVQDG